MARNTGIDNANGDFIFFFDSDDYVATDTVEKCVRTAETMMADTVLFSRNEVYPDGRIQNEKNTFRFSLGAFRSFFFGFDSFGRRCLCV